MMTRRPVLALILACILVSSLAATVAASDFSAFGSSITTSARVSVQGTVNETVSVTYTTSGIGGKETTEWTATNIIENPAALSWNSRLTVEPLEGKLSWNYVRTGGLPPLTPAAPWKSFFR
jgi:hypothetical protein